MQPPYGTAASYGIRQGYRGRGYGGDIPDQGTSRVLRPLLGVMISPPPVIHSYLHHILEHTQGIPDESHLASRNIGPVDGHLDNSPPLFLADIEDLYVETEVLNTLKGKGGVCRFCRKKLKTALRVTESAQDD